MLSASPLRTIISVDGWVGGEMHGTPPRLAKVSKCSIHSIIACGKDRSLLVTLVACLSVTWLSSLPKRKKLRPILLAVKGRRLALSSACGADATRLTSSISPRQLSNYWDLLSLHTHM